MIEHDASSLCSAVEHIGSAGTKLEWALKRLERVAKRGDERLRERATKAADDVRELMGKIEAAGQAVHDLFREAMKHKDGPPEDALSQDDPSKVECPRCRVPKGQCRKRDGTVKKAYCKERVKLAQSASRRW